jgi:hypothetical protein
MTFKQIQSRIDAINCRQKSDTITVRIMKLALCMDFLQSVAQGEDKAVVKKAAKLFKELSID